MDETSSSDLSTIELATELTVAWLNNPNNRVSADDVPGFLQKMHETLTGLGNAGAAEQPQADGQADHTPAVTVRKSLASKDHIISMIDGKPYRTLRRHLATHGLTPDQYRERYGLKSDYPMVAPNYSEARRSMAKQLGLGRKRANTGDEGGNAPASTPAKGRGGRRKAAAPTE